MRLEIFKFFLLMVALSFLGVPEVSAGSEKAWRLQKDLDGIQVYTRKVPNSPILELRGEMAVDAEIEKAAALYEQVDRMMEWFHRSKEVRLLKKVSDEESLVYFAADLPWPLSDRDGIYQRMKSIDPVSQSVVYTLHAVPGRYPRHKERVRVDYLSGEWRFTPLAGKRTSISYRMHTEAGGYIPSGVVNRFTVSLPFNTLRNFRSVLKHAQQQPLSSDQAVELSAE